MIIGTRPHVERHVFHVVHRLKQRFRRKDLSVLPQERLPKILAGSRWPSADEVCQSQKQVLLPPVGPCSLKPVDEGTDEFRFAQSLTALESIRVWKFEYRLRLDRDAIRFNSGLEE